jgi:hypothetical protein
MRLHQSKSAWLFGIIISGLFLVLFFIRLDLFEAFLSRSPELAPATVKNIPDRDAWMSIFQQDQKIGYSHSTVKKMDWGFQLQETVFMRMNTMGMVQDIQIETLSRLKPDFSLSAIVFKIKSGLFDFMIHGTMSGDMMTVKTQGFGSKRKYKIKIKNKPYLMSGIIDAVKASGVDPGKQYVFDIFDPATMAQTPVKVRIIGKEKIRVMGNERTAIRISIQLKGAVQEAWIDEKGEILKEQGLLGISLVKTSRNEALSGITAQPDQDITRVASVDAKKTIDDPHRVRVLRVEINGLPLDKTKIDGGRQKLEGRTLTITKEILENDHQSKTPQRGNDETEAYLLPSPFVQSNHSEIKNLAASIVNPEDSDMEKSKKLVLWVHQNIKKRPVLSLPDAVSTLKHRMGDCNEHAVLLAALARAAGIPAKIEAGMVYQKGRFYYHAWNLLYLGSWVTTDAVFNQLPADVTHIRFTSGAQKQQLDLMGLIGKIDLKVVEIIK